LREAPYAFGSTYAREVAFTEEQWRGRISNRSVTYLAYLPENPEPVGLAGVYVENGVADVVSMWVRPSARGHGVGEALIGATADWAKARGYASLLLWVTESNTPARKLYDRCGFALTGQRQPLPSDPTLPEVRMLRPLSSLSGRGPVPAEWQPLKHIARQHVRATSGTTPERAVLPPRHTPSRV
jgi:GNAT superfamily N-acetyltransferase